MPPPLLLSSCSYYSTTMACSAAAGAEATALLSRLAPSPVAGPSRLAFACRTRRSSLRTAAQRPRKSTTGANPLNGTNFQRDEIATSTDKEQERKYKDEDGVSNLQLEDLVGMIQNTEKNILLLNQARLQALERADKMFKEKEALLRRVNILEARLSDAEISTEGKSNAEINDPPSVDFDMLKEENMLLKDDIEFLKTKLMEVAEAEDRIFKLEKERALLDASLRNLESRFIAAQADMLKLGPRKYDNWWQKVEKLEDLLETTANQVEHAAMALDQNHDLQNKLDKLKASLEATNISKFSCYFLDLLQKKVKLVEERFQACNHEMHSQIELYEHSVVEFHDTLSRLIDESEKGSLENLAGNMPSELWSRISLLIEGWLLEKKLSYNDANTLREMVRKRDNRLREAYLSCRGTENKEAMDNFLKMTLPGISSGLHIVHIAAEMAPVAKDI